MSIKDGGHKVEATKWAEGYDLSPDNMVNHIIGAQTSTLQRYAQLAYILGIRLWRPSHLQEKWRPTNWQHIFLGNNGAKWLNQMQKPLLSIHWTYKCDPEIIQMRCQPTKGPHTLVRAMATGSVEEKDSSMMMLYLAMLRANAARWKSQNEKNCEKTIWKGE